MKNIVTITLGLTLTLSCANAENINIKLEDTEVYKQQKCYDYILKAEKQENLYHRVRNGSYRVNTNKIVNIELYYTKFLVCQKLKEMNK